jgi:hypothetical protein
VASVSKNLWIWTDSCSVDSVDDAEDEVSIRCSCMVMDQVFHDGDQRSNGSGIKFGTGS